ncbi:MAG: hypothetical protein M0P69_18735 [Bacteroidales bacterium]|nr:hypothetical protein [Bacteroidales bacterium]
MTAGTHDIKAFDAVLVRVREMFLSRREQYGDHLERPAFYFRAGLYIKMDRARADLEAGREIKEDTLVDLLAFGLMTLSLPREGACAESNEPTNNC